MLTSQSAPNCEQRVVAYFFSDYRWKESLSAITFLRCILHQLLRMDKISFGIRSVLRRHFGSPNHFQEPTLEDLQKLISDVCTGLSEVFFVVDGLDEVEPDSRTAVLRFLGDMQPRVKIFVASQPEIDVAALFAGSRAVTINVTAQDLKADIQKFIHIQLEQDTAANGILSTYNPCFTKSIKEVLAFKAQGMYVF